ncbi:MAG: hypothetical protein V5A44_10395 [Haloarculaceae archaeon]
MTRDERSPLRGAPELDLGVGEYTITPSERAPDREGELRSVLTGDVDPGKPYHHFDVTGSGGETLLEVVEDFGSTLVDRFGSGRRAYDGVTYRHFLFRSPSGAPRLVLHRGGVATTYALRATATGAVVSTWSKSLGFLGSWRLTGPEETTRATLKKSRSLGDLVSLSRHGTYVVRSTDGSDVARFERTRFVNGFSALTLSELAVTVERSTVPPEVCLALGVGVLLEARESRGVSQGGGDVG